MDDPYNACGSTKAQRAPFQNRTFAHRGLFEADQIVPENSLPAFRAAVEAGYGVELDVQLTKDKVVVVFHDDNLKRVCGVDARVDSYTFEELQAFPLLHTGERIPAFMDVLGVLGGRIPMIVELKSGGDWKTLCEKTLALLKDYRGDYCVEAFIRCSCAGFTGMRRRFFAGSSPKRNGIPKNTSRCISP
jgi:glycerophosphoryl diester phosphodiesterase